MGTYAMTDISITAPPLGRIIDSRYTRPLMLDVTPASWLLSDSRTSATDYTHMRVDQQSGAYLNSGSRLT